MTHRCFFKARARVLASKTGLSLLCDGRKLQDAAAGSQVVIRASSGLDGDREKLRSRFNAPSSLITVLSGITNTASISHLGGLVVWGETSFKEHSSIPPNASIEAHIFLQIADFLLATSISTLVQGPD